LNVVSTFMISTLSAVAPSGEPASGGRLTADPMNQLEPRPHVEADASVKRESVNVSVSASIFGMLDADDQRTRLAVFMARCRRRIRVLCERAYSVPPHSTAVENTSAATFGLICTRGHFAFLRTNTKNFTDLALHVKLRRNAG
jgi:hypothetical protein